MATKLGSMETYLGSFLPIKSNGHIIMWFCEIRDKLKSYLHNQNPHCHKTWQDDYIPWLNYVNVTTWPYYHVLLQYHVTNQNNQFWQGGDIQRGIPFHTIKLQGSLITWLCKFIWHITAAASLLPPQGSWPLYMRNFNPLSHTSLWMCCHMRSRNKSKTFCLHNTYAHQAWQSFLP